MAQSLSNILLHLIFSTKDRRPLLDDSWRDDLHQYMGGIIRDRDGTLLAANSIRDHVHLLLDSPRTTSVSDMVQAIKAGSSRWIHSTHPVEADFKWQRGYGAFSVGAPEKRHVLQYIANQQHHHQTKTFQDEFRQLLQEHQIEFDERYAWE